MRLRAVVCPVYLLLLACILSPAAALTRPSGMSAVAEGSYENMQRVVISVLADARYAGERVVVREGHAILGKGVLAPVAIESGTPLEVPYPVNEAFPVTVIQGSPDMARDAAARVEVPMPPLGKSYSPLDIEIRGKVVATVALPDAELMRLHMLCYEPLKFDAYVLDSDRLPGCVFEKPASVENLIGRSSLRLTYLDAAGKEVATATAPGRYGVIVEVRSQQGWTHRRFVTLYRLPVGVSLSKVDLKDASSLPAALGIAPEVARRSADELTSFLKDKTAQAVLGDQEGAVLLAGLHEQTADAPLSPWNENGDWWLAQRKARGLVRHRYEVLLPWSYPYLRESRYPLLVYLHGAGGMGFDTSRTHRWGGPWDYLSTHHDYEFVLVTPQADPPQGFSPAGINDLLTELLARFRIDPDRVYLTGESMGGRGTWTTACRYPERFAAVAPLCGGGDPNQAARMKALPTWVFHGERDTIVPLGASQEMVDALKAAGGDVRFTILPGATHRLTQVYEDTEFYAWLLAHTRAQR